MPPELPFIDVHSLTVAAPSERVWEETAAVTSDWVRQLAPLLGPAVAPLFMRLLSATRGEWRPAPASAEGVGEQRAPRAIIGFRVCEEQRPSLFALAGEHRFSRYTLTFHVTELAGGRSLVQAETRAAFPGRGGRVYRAMVIGSGGHVRVVRRMLALIRRRAERARRPASVMAEGSASH